MPVLEWVEAIIPLSVECEILVAFRAGLPGGADGAETDYAITAWEPAPPFVHVYAFLTPRLVP